MPAYDPKKIESKIYRLWEKSGFFQPDNLPGNRKKAYSISMPPPNITGVLHMGHALNGTIQDILARYNRMKGLKTLWVPGIDHAGIATQNKVEKKIRKEGKNRKEIGREAFEKEVWKWKKEYGGLILSQFKTMGFSCDWSRLRFTMDKQYSEAVKRAFIHYHEKGLIYRGPRIVNWCPRCETAISDIEIKHREETGKLWYIKYPLKTNSKTQITNYKQIPKPKLQITNNDYITVATTRPETMLGDTAIAVNPKDKRYENLVGKTAILPIINREIPIIADRLVEKDFGTGAVKITPAHDMLDNRIAKNHDLPTINVINEIGRMSENTGKFADLKTAEAREIIVERLKSKNLLEKEEDYDHSISICERCERTIEPIISTQWFIKMKELAKPAIKVVKQKKICFIPARYEKIYLEWMQNIQDWCISRQLWWGHRLPVYFCKLEEIKNQKLKIKNYVVAERKPKRCPICKNCKMEQSEEVLDTWFSSALWPFALLNWPEKTKDLKNFYPNTFLSTAGEIIYLWVARMIFSGMEFLKDIPFQKVYIHPTVLNIKGQRMSKSLGTGVDPLELIEKYGTDALRFGIILQTSRDRQSFKFSEEYVNAGKKFANKLWNINNFIKILENDSSGKNNKQTKSLPDKWILSKFNSTIKEVEKNINDLKFDKALNSIYEFTWHDFADWYIEINKISGFQNIKILKEIYKEIITLLHPFMPFVTEALKNAPQKKDMLMVQEWPAFNNKLLGKKSEKDFLFIQKFILKTRKLRISRKMAAQELIAVKISKSNKILLKHREIIEKFAKAKLIIKA